MADDIDRNVPVANGEYPSLEFEALWFSVTLLAPPLTDIPQMDITQPLFTDSKASPQFEALWNAAAEILAKEDIDRDVILVSDDRATPELEAFWKDLIT